MDGDDSQPTRWLNEREREIWLALREFIWEFPAALDRQLQGESEMSIVEYSVLAVLSECSGARKRAGDLASDLGWERSRLSHLVRRMESKGVVERMHSDLDGRGQDVVLTDAGWAAIREAAPGHVTFVREAVFDPLTPAEQDVLESVLTRIRARIAADGLWAGSVASTACPPTGEPVGECASED
jgi:DNA-binding MarR family transcriptional regulator